MPAVQCPIPNCDYTTPDLDAAIVAALITTHGAVHTTGTSAQTTPVEKVKEPTLTANSNRHCF